MQPFFYETLVLDYLAQPNYCFGKSLSVQLKNNFILCLVLFIKPALKKNFILKICLAQPYLEKDCSVLNLRVDNFLSNT